MLENNCDACASEERLPGPMLAKTDDAAEAPLLSPVLKCTSDVPGAMKLLMPKGDALTDFSSKPLESGLSRDGVTEVEAPVEAPEPNWNEGTVQDTGVADDIVGLPELVLATMLAEKTEVTELSQNVMVGAAEVKGIDDAAVSEPLLKVGVVEAPQANSTGLVELDNTDEAAFPHDLNTSPAFWSPPLSDFEPSRRVSGASLLQNTPRTISQKFMKLNSTSRK